MRTALTHGTNEWTGQHTRRTLLYKYSQSHVVYGNAPTVPVTEGVTLSEQAERLFAVAGQLGKTLQLGEPDYANSLAHDGLQPKAK